MIQQDILTDEIVKRKSYTCRTSRSAKGKNTHPSEDCTEYAFDTTKVGQIFDHMLKDKHIWLLDAHVIPPTRRLKARCITNGITHIITQIPSASYSEGPFKRQSNKEGSS